LESDDLFDGESSEFGLVVPFVICQSQGGQLDDEAFTIGYELGSIDAELSMCASLFAQPPARYVHAVGLAQLDLLAMRRGYLMHQGELDESEEWARVEFEMQEGVDDE